MSGAMRTLMVQGAWRVGPTDMFGVLGRARDELSHSRVLGWLLDPIAQHGLGDRFLRRVLSELGAVDALEWPYGVQVHLELSRTESRADVVVVLGDRSLVVENKVDAIEGPDQCWRIARDHPDAILAFLSPAGRSPMSAGDSHQRWNLLSWVTVRRILEAVVEGDRPEAKGAHLIDDYVTTLRRQF